MSMVVRAEYMFVSLATDFVDMEGRTVGSVSI